ncbi:MAG: hypothetical protein ACSHYF_05245 [Verrucomicrobiaceae bacterium]
MCGKFSNIRIKFSRSVLLLHCSLLQFTYADLELSFEGEADKEFVTWTASGCLTIATDTSFGPLNDTSLLYPNGGPGWTFFSDTGFGENLVKKNASTTVEAGGSFNWIIKDSQGTEIQTITVPITGWLISQLYQSIEPRTAPYTVPNLEIGQQLCWEGTGTFMINPDPPNNESNTLNTVFREGTKQRDANGGLIKQTVKFLSGMPPYSYEEFQATAFPPDADPEKIRPSDDYDGDGISNYYEYATDTSPTFKNKSQFVVGEILGTPCFQFWIRLDDPNIAYTIKYSDTLLQFESTGLTINLDQNPDIDIKATNPSAPFTFIVQNPDMAEEFRHVTVCYNGTSKKLFAVLEIAKAE